MGFSVKELVEKGASYTVPGILAGANKENANAMREAAQKQTDAAVEAARIYTEAAKEAQALAIKAAETRRTEDIAAANEAAQKAEAALVQAIPSIEAAVQSGADQSNAEFAGALNTIRTGLQPYMQTGTEANARLNAMMFGSPEEREATFAMDPGYKFRMEQGQQALERSAAGRGNLNSGNTMIDVMKYGQDYGSSEFDKAFNRLVGLSATGQAATNTMGGYEWGGAGVKSENAKRVADTKAQNALNLANTRGTNAWNVSRAAMGGNQALSDTTSQGAWKVAGATGQGADITANALSNQAYMNMNADIMRNNFWPEYIKWAAQTGAAMYGAGAGGAGGGMPMGGGASMPTYSSTYGGGNAMNYNPNYQPRYY